MTVLLGGRVAEHLGFPYYVVNFEQRFEDAKRRFEGQEVPPRVEYQLTPLGRRLMEPVRGLVFRSPSRS